MGTSTGTAFTDPHLQPNSAYTYTVRSFDNAQNHSIASNVVAFTSAVEGPDTDAPSVPLGLSSQLLYATKVSLEWDASIDSGSSGIQGYRVYRDGSEVSGPNPIPETSFEEPSLTFSTAYVYTVTAVDNANNASAPSSPSNISTTSFIDNFNRSNGALGVPWAIPQSDVAVSQNVAMAQTTSGGGPWIWNSATYPDTLTSFKASLNVSANPHGTNTGLLFYYGWNATTSKWFGYRLYLSNGSNYYLNLVYYPDLITGAGAEVPYWTVVSSPTGVMRVEANGATGNIKIYFDEVLMANLTEPTSRMSGQVGVTACFRTTSGSMDDFTADQN